MRACVYRELSLTAAQVYDAGEYFILSPGRAQWKVLVTQRLAASDGNR